MSWRSLGLALLALIVVAPFAVPVMAAQPTYGDVDIAGVKWGWDWGCGVYPGDKQVPLRITFINGDEAISGIAVEAHLEGLPLRGGGGGSNPRAIVSPLVVPPGGAFEATFQLDVQKNATPGVYTIPVTLSYHIVEIDQESLITVSWQDNATLTLPSTAYGPEIKQEFVVEVVIGRPCGVLSIGVSQYPSELRAGDSGFLVISLKNLGGEALRDVIVKIQPLSLGASFQASWGSPGFDVGGLATGASSSQSVGIALEGKRVFFFESIPAGGSTRFTVSVRVSEGCPRGVYQLPIKISYRRLDGTFVEEMSAAQVIVSTPLSRPTSLEPARPHINLVTVETSPSSLKVGSLGNLTLTLYNAGPGDAFSLSLEFVPREKAEESPLAGLLGAAGAAVPYMGTSEGAQAAEGDFPLKVLNGASRLFLGDLKAGESATVSLLVGVDASADSGFLEVPLSLRYQDEIGNRYEEVVYIGIVVERPAELTLVVEDASSHPGEELILRGEVVNFGQGDAEGITIELVDGGDYFRQLEPAIVTRVPAGDREDVSLRVLVSDAAPPGTYELTFRISYRSGLSQVDSAESTVVVTVAPQTHPSQRVSLSSWVPWAALLGSGVAGSLGRLMLRRRKGGPYYEPEDFTPPGGEER